MALFKKKQCADPEAEKLKSFLDMIAPSLVKFEFDRYFCGNSIRCVWALREYPTATDDQAILRHLGEMHGVTLHIYTRIHAWSRRSKNAKSSITPRSATG